PIKPKEDATRITLLKLKAILINKVAKNPSSSISIYECLLPLELREIVIISSSARIFIKEI
ncbi:MAG: hypothetical protein Q8853_02970, partial [Candidatus Phytoplasma australasiaticum]|nr:hypothetical protein [Candidatus Phytoplasma australasiaticum]